MSGQEGAVLCEKKGLDRRGGGGGDANSWNFIKKTLDSRDVCG